jgi:ribonuclease D
LSTQTAAGGEPASAAELQAADAAVSEARFITDAGDAACLASEWQKTDTIGLDTEFVRERTFYPRPGLIQASDGQAVWLLDAVAMPRMEPLADLLDDAKRVKVLHSVGEDMEVFQILTGTVPDPLFDTQVAAAMLGFPLQLRYEQLVAETLGAELAGGKARSDWCKRPLSRDLLTYAAQDVIWLPRLKDFLTEQLDNQGRLDWLVEDCARTVASARSDERPLALLRVKGAGRVDDKALAVLERLAEWREETARRRDLPKSFVIRDEHLLQAAEKTATDGPDAAVRALPDPVRRRYRDVLFELLETHDSGDFRRPAALVQLTNQQRDWIKQAQKTVRSIAEDLGIDPALIASKRELTKIAHGDRPDWLDGWRGDLLGESFSNQ